MSDRDPGSDSAGLPQPGDFGSVGDWFEYVLLEGFRVPVHVPRAISFTQRELGCSVQEAFEWLRDRRLLLDMTSGIAVDLRATSPEFWQSLHEEK